MKKVSDPFFIAVAISVTVHLWFVLAMGRGTIFPSLQPSSIEFAHIDIRQIIQPSPLPLPAAAAAVTVRAAPRSQKPPAPITREARSLPPSSELTHQAAATLKAELKRIPQTPAIRIDLGDDAVSPDAAGPPLPSISAALLAAAPRLSTLQIAPPTKRPLSAPAPPPPGASALAAPDRSIPIEDVIAKTQAAVTASAPPPVAPPATARRVAEMAAINATPLVDPGRLAALPRVEEIAPPDRVGRMNMPELEEEKTTSSTPANSDAPQLAAAARPEAAKSWLDWFGDAPTGEAPSTPTSPGAVPQAAGDLRALGVPVGGSSSGSARTGAPSPHEQPRGRQTDARSAAMPEIALPPQAAPPRPPRPSNRDVTVSAVAHLPEAARPDDANSGLKVLVQPHPHVPRSHPLYKSGEVRSVKLAIVIDVGGLVNTVRVKQSSGDATLDALAAEAVRHWRYSSGAGDYRTVTVTYDLR